MNKMNIKKIWSGICEIVNIRNNISTKITQLNINGKIIDNPKDVANQLNDFFVNVGPLAESSIIFFTANNLALERITQP